MEILKILSSTVSVYLCQRFLFTYHVLIQNLLSPKHLVTNCLDSEHLVPIHTAMYVLLKLSLSTS
jgi:hypothetical protein